MLHTLIVHTSISCTLLNISHMTKYFNYIPINKVEFEITAYIQHLSN